MNQSDAQAKYKELKEKLEAAECTGFIGIASGLERMRAVNNLNAFKVSCSNTGITLLEPCPFCGSYDVEMHDSKYDEYQEGKFIECNNCDCCGPRNDQSSVIAIAAWNTRVS